MVGNAIDFINGFGKRFCQWNLSQKKVKIVFQSIIIIDYKKQAV